MNILYIYIYVYTDTHTYTRTCIHACVSIIHTHDVHYQDLFCPHRSVARERRELTLPQRVYNMCVSFSERADPAARGESSPCLRGSEKDTHTLYTHVEER